MFVFGFVLAFVFVFLSVFVFAFVIVFVFVFVLLHCVIQLPHLLLITNLDLDGDHSEGDFDEDDHNDDDNVEDYDDHRQDEGTTNDPHISEQEIGKRSARVELRQIVRS